MLKTQGKSDSIKLPKDEIVYFLLYVDFGPIIMSVRPTIRVTACSSAKYIMKILPKFLLNCWISVKVLLEGKVILTEKHFPKKSLKDFL